MFKKPVWDDLSFVTCIILLEVQQKMVHCSHKGMDMVRNNTQAVAFKRCSIGTKGPKVCQENIPPHHYTTTTTSLNRWDKEGWIHAFIFFTPNSDSTIWTLKQKSRLIRPGKVFTIFYSLILVILCELYPPFPVLRPTGAAPGVVFCCCIPSASGFDVLCVQRWYSAYLGCNEWLFELLLSFYHLYPV